MDDLWIQAMFVGMAGAWLAGGNLPPALVFALVVAVSVDVGLQAN